MAVRINLNPEAELSAFFERIVESGKFGEKFIQFSSIDILEQAVIHSRLMQELPEDVSVTDLHVTVPPRIIDRIGSSGTFEYLTKWGAARIVIVGYHVTIEATDPRSFLDAHRAILNDLLTSDHRILEQSYPA